MKKLTEEQKSFVAKVAEDSVNQTIDVDQIREAFKLLSDDDSTMNIRIMRKRLYDHFMNPKPDVLPDFANPDFDISQELPTDQTPAVEPKKAGRPRLNQK